MIFPKETVEFGECIQLKNKADRAKDNYPILHFQKERWRAHRLSYNLNCESIPSKVGSTREGFVLHTCDNKWCIRPDHLYLGTAKQNVKDTLDRFVGLREKMSASQKARVGPLSRGFLGKKHSDETIQKMKISAKERFSKMSKEERFNHMKPASRVRNLPSIENQKAPTP